MVTSEDVARLAGVSRATVSRILNGSVPVSEDLRLRVQKAVSDLGYEPDIAARSLVGQPSRLIVLGLFAHDVWALSGVAQTEYSFYLSVLRHIERRATAAGYDLLLPSLAGGTGGSGYVRSLRARRVAGVILGGCSASDARIPALLEEGMPTIFIDVRASGPMASYVTSDSRAGAAEVTGHLIGLGHQRIAIVAGPDVDLAGVERLAGTREALGGAGLPADPALVRQLGWSSEDGHLATTSLLDSGASFTAVVALSDMLAMGALRALHEHGLRVPQDISVTGFDDIDLCTDTNPPLTTVRQDAAAMAEHAMGALVRMIEGSEQPVGPIVLPTELVVRASTASVAAAGRP